MNKKLWMIAVLVSCCGALQAAQELFPRPKKVESFWPVIKAVDAPERVQQLLAAGMPIDLKDSEGKSLLSIAAFAGHLPIVSYLVAQGAKDPAALAAAISARREEVVRYLLNHGFDVNAKVNDEAPIALAMARYQPDLVLMLIAAGANLTMKGGGMEILLPMAVRLGYDDLVKRLVDGGIDVDGRDEYGHTALMNAAKKDLFLKVKYLVENGADMSLKDGAGQQAWQMTSNKEIVDYLKSEYKKQLSLPKRIIKNIRSRL